MSAPNIVTTSNVRTEGANPDGHQYGASATDPVAFYGATPISQPHTTAQGVITDASGGNAAATNGILTLTGTYNSTILANAIATLAAQTNAVRAALVSLGLIKGSN